MHMFIRTEYSLQGQSHEIFGLWVLFCHRFNISPPPPAIFIDNTKSSLLVTLKGSVQRKLRWVYNSANHWVLAWDCGAGHYLEFLIHHCLVLNIFPFPVSTAKFVGEFYNNRRSATNRCPRFAYSLVSLMLSKYY
jgi:hypothetical protein